MKHSGSLSKECQTEKTTSCALDFVSSLKFYRKKQTPPNSLHPAPQRTKLVKVDGDCFFRSLFVVKTGKEGSYAVLRDFVQSHMEKNSVLLKELYDAEMYTLHRGGLPMPRYWVQPVSSEL